MADSSMTRPLVELHEISKRFGGTQALDAVTLSILPGEIHAFVGENGAGKSTLGKVIAGIYGADSGTLVVDGDQIERWNPGLAQRRGIAMIAQELALVPDLTVAQNVFLGIEEHVLGFERANLDDRFAELEKEIRFGLDPHRRVRELRIADQQKVEIMRALARNAQVIVMDEPTSSLTAKEMDQLEDLMRSLRDRGCCVIYVSHFLDSVLAVSDRITVMRDGHKIGTMQAEDATKQDIVTAMLGRALGQAYPDRSAPIDSAVEPILVATGIATDTGVADMSFEVRPGEVVGLLGLVGSGRSECARAIFGVDRLRAGVVVVGGATVTKPSPTASLERGFVLVSEDRHRDGLVLQRSVRENISLASLDRVSRGGIVSRRREKAVSGSLARSLEIRPPDIELPVSWFSGGNQQKSLLAKALATKPTMIILDEPTRGVDVGAKRTIYELIVRLAAEGIGILLISSEHEEIMELAHRAYLVSNGRTIGEVVPAETSVDDVLVQLFNVPTGEESAA